MGGTPFSSFGGRQRNPRKVSRGTNTAKQYNIIPPGTVVSLKGLINNPERNGDMGAIQRHDYQSQRYIVKFEDTKETMSVKANNPERNGDMGAIQRHDYQSQRYIAP